MHVVYLITRGDAVGGATIHVRDLARELIRSGEQATVLVGGKGEAHDEFVRYGIPCESLPSLQRNVKPWRDTRALAQMVAALTRLKPDLVSAHTAKAGLLGRLAARLVGVPAVFTPHGWAMGDRLSGGSARVFGVAERLAAPLATSIVNVCRAEWSLAERSGIPPRDRFEMIHNGVYDIPTELRARPRMDPPHLVMVARFEPPKDPLLLLTALSRLRNRAWSLEFVGGGLGLDVAKQVVSELGMERRVLFTGSSQDVAEHLSRAQIFVLSSRSEAFPRSILEAMRAGLPVVASDVGGVAEAVNGETGIVVPRGDADRLADGLQLLIENPDLRADLGWAGRLRYERHFTFSTTFARTVALYDRILCGSAQVAVPAGARK